MAVSVIDAKPEGNYLWATLIRGLKRLREAGAFIFYKGVVMGDAKKLPPQRVSGTVQTEANNKGMAATTKLTLPELNQLTLPFTLPSYGVPYGGAIPGGNVVISPLRGEQEEALAGTGTGPHTSKAIRHIVKALVNLNGFPFERLLLSDFVALTLNVMAFSYDPNISVNIACPECKKRNQYDTEVGKLPCDFLTEEKFKDHTQYQVELPVSKVVIGFRPLTLEDVDAIEKFTQRHQAEADAKGSRPELTFGVAKAITQVNGKTVDEFGGLVPLRMWLRDMTGRDLSALRKAMNNAESGYNLSPEIECQHCGHLFEVRLPEAGEFFRGKTAAAGNS